MQNFVVSLKKNALRAALSSSVISNVAAALHDEAAAAVDNPLNPFLSPLSTLFSQNRLRQYKMLITQLCP